MVPMLWNVVRFPGGGAVVGAVVGTEWKTKMSVVRHWKTMTPHTTIMYQNLSAP